MLNIVFNELWQLHVVYMWICISRASCKHLYFKVGYNFFYLLFWQLEYMYAFGTSLIKFSPGAHQYEANIPFSIIIIIISSSSSFMHSNLYNMMPRVAHVAGLRLL